MRLKQLTASRAIAIILVFAVAQISLQIGLAQGTIHCQVDVYQRQSAHSGKWSQCRPGGIHCYWSND